MFVLVFVPTFDSDEPAAGPMITTVAIAALVLASCYAHRCRATARIWQALVRGRLLHGHGASLLTAPLQADDFALSYTMAAVPAAVPLLAFAARGLAA
jgi:hypothetical protein